MGKEGDLKNAAEVFSALQAEIAKLMPILVNYIAREKQ
jgi:hypothetical protein